MAKKRSFVQGTAILAATVVLVKLIGAIYKIPLYNILDDKATTYYGIAYTVYSLLLTISTSGVPTAIARLISAASSTGKQKQAQRIFNIALPAFGIIGAVCGILMMVFCRQIAAFMEVPGAYQSIFILGPAVFFCCIVSVYRGYSQGHEDMVPTSVSQIIEVLCKLAAGLPIALLLLNAGRGAGFVSAGAIAGVTIGLGLAVPVLAYLRRRSIKNNTYEVLDTDPSVLSKRDTLKEIFRVSIPMTLSASLLSLLALVDTKVIMYHLKNTLSLAENIVEMQYSAYTRANTMFNLPSNILVSIAVAIVPAVAAAVARRQYKESATLMSSSLKLMNLFALPAGVGLCVLSNPIYNVLYWDGNELGPQLLAIMGIASYFVCFQVLSTSLVQASGYEKMSLISLPAGSILKLIVNWVLVAIPAVGILGAPIGSLVCYAFISLFNMAVLMKRVPEKPKLGAAFIKPLICTAIMGVCAWAVYGILTKVGGGFFVSGRLPMLIAMVAAIGIAVIVYFIMIIVTGTLTKEDMKLVPKGDKIASVLKLK